MYNFSNYKPTYNSAIDYCVNLIACARRNNMPIKALHLSPMYYEWFRSGVQTLMDKPIDADQPLMFDGVDIEKGTKFQRHAVLPEYYQLNTVDE